MDKDLYERVMNRLKMVTDPDTRTNVVELEVIDELVTTEGGEVSLKFLPGSFTGPLALQIVTEIWQSIREVKGVKDVHLEVIGLPAIDRIDRCLKKQEVKV